VPLVTALVILLLAIALVGVGVLLGALLSDDQWRRERARLAAREAGLNAKWRSLHAVNRINVAFWMAREAMRREAERHQGEE
jgi:CHASE1-domain containing sensor protein